MTYSGKERDEKRGVGEKERRESERERMDWRNREIQQLFSSGNVVMGDSVNQC